MKVVINKCFGGFGLSPKAMLWLYERGFRPDGFATPVEEYYGSFGKIDEDLKKWREYLTKDEHGQRDALFLTVFTPDEKFALSTPRTGERANPLLVECVETLGDKSFGGCARLRVVEIPDGIEWEIDEYDGQESIAEAHRSWG